MNEFELIEHFLAPLAGEGSFGLTDDTAFHHGMVMTKDVLVDGVHFRTEDGWGVAAQKSLRVNISDIVAKGATPDGVLLGMVWPKSVTKAEISAYCQGLAEDMRLYGLNLLGGDTTRHGKNEGPLTVSVTLTGRPGPRGQVLRSGAKPGDLVFVTGTIGDGWLGLQAKLNGWHEYPQATEAYLRPSPPTAIADAIGQYASASIDISDGLVADAGHVAKASRVMLLLNAEDIPLSDEAQRWRAKGGDLSSLLTNGDDYQSLITIPPADIGKLADAAKAAGVQLTKIGVVKKGEPRACILGKDGSEQVLSRPGFSHF